MSREYDYVVNLLNNSISPVETTRNQALEVILGLELNPSFLLTLLEVGTSNNDSVSRLSLILLKKSFYKLHSFTKRKNINPNLDYGNIYQDLKANLLQSVTVKYVNNQAFLPKDLCLLVRRQCRDDFPHNWMDMYKMILMNLNSVDEGGEIKAFNLVFLIYHIFKERMSVLLPSFRGYNYRIAQDLFPHISNLWARQFFGKWKVVEANTELFPRYFSETELRTSVYLDNTLYNFYSHGIKEIHKNRHLLELLYNMFLKFKILSKINVLKIDQTGMVKKNVSRVLRGLDRLISNNPLSMVFIDFSVFLNEIFDILVRKDWKDVECECIIVLKRIFGSSTMNNENYMNMYFDQVERLPVIETKVAPVEVPPRHSQKDISNLEYYENYEALLRFNRGEEDEELWEMMSRQLTFSFYKVLSLRGGFLKFLDLIRTNYMKVDMEILEEWNLDQYPEISPSRKVVDELILEMDIKFVEIFGLIFNAIMEYNEHEFFEYDTYLQLYILSFRNFYEYHKSEHFMALLQVFYILLEFPVKEYTGLMIYRISRIVNMWCKKKLISQGVKKEILKFLIKAISSENIKVRVQHVVPFYNMYKNTEDEPIWPDLFRRYNIHSVVKSLLEIAEVDVPIIRLRALELLCNFCMEYDEEGINLSMILKMYMQLDSASVCEAALNTILDYIRRLDMPPVMMDQYVLNANFLTFFLGIIKSTVEMDERNATKIKRITRFNLVDETFMEMWLSFLRIYSVRKGQIQSLKELFEYFGPLVNYFTENDSLKERTIFSTFGLKILAEYVLILGSYLEMDQEFLMEKMGEEVIFKNAITAFSKTRLTLMISNASNEEIELPISVYHYLGFDENWGNQSLILLATFFESLEKLGSLQGSTSRMSELALNQKSTKPQQMTILEENSSDIEKILPFVNKIAFTTQAFHIFVQSKNQSEVELWLNERLLTLFNLTKSLKRNHILQLGCIILSCYIISSYPHMVYPFVQYKGERYYTDDFDSENTSVYQSHPGTFIMSYFLKILSNNSRNYRFVSEIRSKGIKEEKIPGSRRFEYVKYAWLTNSNKPYRSDVYDEGLELALRSIVEATRRMPEGYLNLLLANVNKLSSEVQGLLKSIVI